MVKIGDGFLELLKLKLRNGGFESPRKFFMVDIVPYYELALEWTFPPGF